jgi:hypothetical protein
MRLRTAVFTIGKGHACAGRRMGLVQAQRFGTLAMGSNATSQTINPTPRTAAMSAIAKGNFQVKLLPLPFEGQSEGSKLGRMSIDKEITGDLVATTKGQMLSAFGDVKGSAGYVAIERVEGALQGREGSFVLQHTGTMNRGTPSLLVTVVPDSGTGGLAGLAGEFKIIIADGKHNYEFAYTLP